MPRHLQINPSATAGSALLPTDNPQRNLIVVNQDVCGALTLNEALKPTVFLLSPCYFELPNQINLASFVSKLELAYNVKFEKEPAVAPDLDEDYYFYGGFDFAFGVAKSKENQQAYGMATSECKAGRF